MDFRDQYKLRHLEDNNVQKQDYEKVKNRVAMEHSSSIKKNIIMILIGIFCTVTLTAFEYALKSPEVEGLLKIVFRVGFFTSIVGILYLPYGLYDLIRGFMRKKV